MTARTDDIVTRLHGLHPRLIDLSLGRLHRLLDTLDHPERRLPPVIHVAGTNGKGSTCAYLRAMSEAAGWRAHVYTSPHLVRFNERIRVAGHLVDDATLDATLEEVERINAGDPITVFEIVTAAAFVLFARVPADLCVIEVGLGGRYDATNVLSAPSACAITSISLDHQEFLGDTLEKIAAEKAGIMKPGRPVAIGAQVGPVARALDEHIGESGAIGVVRGRDWQIERYGDHARFSDAAGSLDVPLPALPGVHQLDNAGIALAALRASGLAPPDSAWRGLAHATWPARLQRLTGAFVAKLPADWEVWLDGGHNAGAGVVLADQAKLWADRPLHLVVGMKSTKDAAGFLRPLLPLVTSVWAVCEPGQHLALPVEAIIDASGGVARAGPTVGEAFAHLPRGAASRVLICGSLYLAGVVLKMAGPAPD